MRYDISKLVVPPGVTSLDLSCYKIGNQFPILLIEAKDRYAFDRNVNANYAITQRLRPAGEFFNQIKNVGLKSIYLSFILAIGTTWSVLYFLYIMCFAYNDKTRNTANYFIPSFLLGAACSFLFAEPTRLGIVLAAFTVSILTAVTGALTKLMLDLTEYLLQAAVFGMNLIDSVLHDYVYTHPLLASFSDIPAEVTTIDLSNNALNKLSCSELISLLNAIPLSVNTIILSDNNLLKNKTAQEGAELMKRLEPFGLRIVLEKAPGLASNQSSFFPSRNMPVEQRSNEWMSSCVVS